MDASSPTLERQLGLFGAVRDSVQQIDNRLAVGAAVIPLIEPVRDQKAEAQYQQIANRCHGDAPGPQLFRLRCGRSFIDLGQDTRHGSRA